MKKLTATATALAIITASSMAHAAVITWGAATAITTGTGNSSDVLTTGTLHYAIDGEGSNSGNGTAETVNGVQFNTAAAGDGGGLDLWSPSPVGDAAYNTLLSFANNGLGGPSVTLSLGSGSGPFAAIPALTNGQQYLIQVWYADDRSGFNSRVMTFGDGNGNNVNLNDQYAVGTFTAIGTTQDLLATANSFGQAHINALQIRAIPEVSSVMLGALGCLAMLRRRR